MQKTIDELLAEAAIKDLQTRYCRAVDRVDLDLLRSCFHADAKADYGLFVGGVEELIAMLKTGVELYLWTTHCTSNQLVEVRGDKAWAEHYAIATHRLTKDEQGPERDLVTQIRYIDRVEKRADDWRIAERVLILDWWRVDPVHEFGPGPAVQRGQRDRSDASYRLKM
jgi:hypothetical protein